MIVDILCVVLIVLAVIKGYSKGLVVALFSFLAIVVGVIAAVKFSSIVAGWLEESTNVGNRWLPFLSFIIIIAGVVIGVRLLAKFIEKSMQVVMMGWLNRLGGILLYLAIYLMVFSVVIFYLEKLNILKPETLSSSVSYPVISPFAPKIIEGVGAVIPWFSDMFSQLGEYFDGIAKKAS